MNDDVTNEPINYCKYCNCEIVGFIDPEEDVTCETCECKEEKVMCYYHNDMDGIMSASIVKTIYPNAKFIKVNYGDVPDVLDIVDSVVIIVDFSFDNVMMKKIHNDSKLLCWIDHHESARLKNKELWDSEDIDGFRDTSKAGCELTWEWFYPYDEAPLSVELIADRDMWKFEYGDKTRAFHEFISMTVKDPNTTITDKGSWIDDAISKGMTLLHKKQEQIKKSFEQGADGTFHKYKTRIINTNVNVSETGEYCYKEKGYHLVVIWSLIGNIFVFSLRSNIIDVREIAEKFGGGGHKFAAGFKLDFEDGLIFLGNWME